MNICLCMIVRDESHVIERCLRSVLPLVTSWVVCDTGSTDDTKEKIKTILAHLPGDLYEDEWVHFAHNRTLAIQRACARKDSDYILVIDADHEWVGELPLLDADCYMVEHHYANLKYGIPCLMRTDKEWHYECPVHETVHGHGTGPTQGLDPKHGYVKVYPEGARSRDPKKFEKDAALMLQYVAEHPDHPRATYYLAQSYRDAAVMSKDADEIQRFTTEARKWYERRAEMDNGWWEERWHARYQVARMAQALKLDFAIILTEYLAAYQDNPARAEPLFDLALHAREKTFYAIATTAARQAMGLPLPPTTHLFVQPGVYEFGAMLEFSISAYYLPHHKEEGLKVCQKLLQRTIPPHIRQCVEQNVGWYKGTFKGEQQKAA